MDFIIVYMILMVNDSKIVVNDCQVCKEVYKYLLNRTYI